MNGSNIMTNARHDPKLLIHCEKAPASAVGFPLDKKIALVDLAQLRSLDVVPGATGGSDPRSLLYLDAEYDQHGALREGTWYELPVKSLGLSFEPGPWDGEGPAFLRGVLRAKRRIYAPSYRVPPRPYKPRQAVSLGELTLPTLGSSKILVVVDCGQGNWNEVTTNERRLIYDTGCSYTWSSSQVRQLVASRRLATDSRPIDVVISHWDVDHFCALLEATAAELAHIFCLLGPDNVPGTATVRRFFKHMAAASVPVNLVAPQPRQRGDGRTIALHEAGRSADAVLFRATTGASRNQTGIVLGVLGSQRDAVLTGDHHHPKVLDALLRAKIARGDIVYVVPHHGGRAGLFDASRWRASVASLDAAISYGANNQYGHPFPAVLGPIRQVAAQVLETASSGDLSWPLG